MIEKILSKEEYLKFSSIKEESDAIAQIAGKEVANYYKHDVDFLLYVITRLECQLTDLKKVCEVNKMFINFDVLSFKEELNSLLSKYYLLNS